MSGDRNAERSALQAVTVTARRRHLRAAGVSALITLAAFAGAGIWSAVNDLTHPDAVVLGLALVTYAFAGLTVLRLIGAALAWPR